MSTLSLQASEACHLEITQVLLGANAKSDPGVCTWTVHVLYYRPVESSPFFLSVYCSPFGFYFPRPAWVLRRPLCPHCSMCLGSLHGLQYFVPSLYSPAGLQTVMTAPLPQRGAPLVVFPRVGGGEVWEELCPLLPVPS